MAPPPSSDYRLLCYGIDRDYNNTGNMSVDARRHYYILCAGSGFGAGAALPPPRRLAARGLRNPTPFYDAPVAHRGILHWLPRVGEDNAATDKMIVFDTAAETFRRVAQPPPPRRDDREIMRTLLEIDGELSVATAGSTTSLDIWALEDYGAERWALRHRIEVPMPRVFPADKVMVSRVIPLGSGVILIGSPGCRVGRLYDLSKKKVIDGDFDFDGASATFHVFAESLVRHAFFDDDDSPWCPHLEPISFSINPITLGRDDEPKLLDFNEI